jgi:hypothetical protein
MLADPSAAQNWYYMCYMYTYPFSAVSWVGCDFCGCDTETTGYHEDHELLEVLEKFDFLIF